MLAFLASVPALIVPGVVTRLAGLWELARSPNPFFLPAQALDLWVLAPAVTLSAILLFLLPGVLLVRAFGGPKEVPALTVLGFGASLLLLVALETATKLITGGQLSRTLLLGEWLAVIGVVSWLYLSRPAADDATAAPAGPAEAGRRLLLLAGTAWLGAAALAPKIHWENFNLDGIEAFEFGRSLASHVQPHWDLHSATFGFYNNFVLFAWPNHFFLSVFGPVEAAVRLPILLYLVVLFAALILLIEHGARRRLGIGEELALFIAIALFLVVQAFNTNYEPFYSDLAETAATDTLWIACFLAAVWALWTGRFAWFWVFGFMNYTASPGGLFLLMAMAPAVFLAAGPERRARLGAIVALLAACFAANAAYELLYAPIVLAGTSDQFSTLNLVRRLVPPTLTEWARLSTLVFATGILPAVGLLTVKRRDGLAWSMAVVTLLYFGLVYAQVWASVHQFTPAMVLPHIVFWRGYLDGSERRQRILLPLSASLSAVCLVLSLPRHDRINIAVREVGQATDFRFADYESDYVTAAGAARAVYWLFPEEYRLAYPDQPWGTDGYAWLYYASRPKPPGAAVAYVIQAATAPVPENGLLAGGDSVVAAYVVDESVWQRQKSPDVPRVAMSPLYEPVLRSMYRFFREYSAQVQREQAASDGS